MIRKQLLKFQLQSARLLRPDKRATRMVEMASSEREELRHTLKYFK